jgi:hypothetical protein
VGKSSILRDIVNFFIELNAQVNDNNRKTSLSKGLLRGLRYHIDGQECFVVKTDKSYVATINGKICKLEHIKIPSIVACHFGAFDKFPNQTIDGTIKTKYDVPFYKYIGAHINGSMISSSAIAFRLLFALTQQVSINLQKNICSILDFIKYDHTISLQYSLVFKSRKNGSAYESIKQGVEKDKECLKYSIKEKQEFASQLYDFYKDKANLDQSQCVYKIDFENEGGRESERCVLKYLYKLKQYNLLGSVRVWFYKQGQIISSDEMSSGEFAMLATILSIAAAANNHHTLVLIDEPELSQHPNWQMSLIENLDKALANQACQLLIATHSHMLVSDLPQGRSNVIQLDKMSDGSLLAKMIGCSTYGWSAEEVLLKEQNLLAYAYYVYITHQDKKFEMLKNEVEYLTDEESFMLAKADLLFPAYYNFEEVNKSVKQWKSVQINGKWLNEAEALNYALVDIILDDLNPRLKRVNLKYADAIYSFYIKYKKTFLQAFIHRLERKRR